MKMTIEEMFMNGVDEHKKGNLEKAKKIYINIIKLNPKHHNANNNLGLISLASFKSELSLHYFEKAIKVNSSIEQYFFNYINALINLGKIDKARKSLKDCESNNFNQKTVNHLYNRCLNPIECFRNGNLYKANNQNYIEFLKILHKKKYNIYFEIGSRNGNSLSLSKSPSIAIDPYFQLEKNPIGDKEFCFLFQQTSDDFFEKSIYKLPNLKCELGFIDGMHLFENALRDFLNLAKISSDKSLLLVHDILPWTVEMASRDFKSIPKGFPWTGDVWKLILILINEGLKENMNILSSAPSGLLAIYNPCKKIISKIEKNFEKICSLWLNIKLDNTKLEEIYNSGIFINEESFLQVLEKQKFGEIIDQSSKTWVSH